MWIGLLWYFNVVQTPGLAAAAADKGGPGRRRHLEVHRAARAVVVPLGSGRDLAHAARTTSCSASGRWTRSTRPSCWRRALRTIGVGAWLGTIMLFNVWVLIWPNQKKILGIKPATDEEKAAARKTAGMASRVNFVLSIPMLMCMGAHTHGLPF